MMSSEIAYSLATLCGAIAAIVIITVYPSHNAVDDDDDDTTFITRYKAIKQAAKEKITTSKEAANKKEIITGQQATDKRNKKDINKKDMIISRMPDQILISILAHLPTKFAVRTSVLSKRWRNLYKFVPDIDFNCHGLVPRSHEDFIYRVQKFLKLRCRSRPRSLSNIRSFQFSCSYADGLEKCIYYLGRLGVEELHLYFLCCEKFPSCRKLSCCRSSSDHSFNCQLLSELPSLKYCQLAFCSIEPSVKDQYNSIQTLSLMDVRILPSALHCILTNCLSLHSLIIDRGECPSKLYFCGRNLQLKSLVIKYCIGLEEIEFFAYNLTMFEFHNPAMVNFIFDHVPQLQSVHLYLEYGTTASYIFEELAKDLPHLKSLAVAISGHFNQVSRRHMGTGIETFSNLTRLEMEVQLIPETNLLALTSFLDSCPLLQEFFLDLPYNLEDDEIAAQVQPRKLVVLHSELKKVKISGFSGTENEMEFASYILKGAVSLEQMHIIWRIRDDYEMRDITPWHKMDEKQWQELALSKTAQITIQCALESG